MDTSKNERLVIDGNSFYEIDLQCIQKKQNQKQKPQKERSDQEHQHQSKGTPPVKPRYTMQKRQRD
ncbi:hypothetical protein DWW86_01315 [Ruminococcus sp. AF17-22AC]|nr:hypothetical protein DWW86_01315 [Ruminococcus sp. AF17-22AC]